MVISISCPAYNVKTMIFVRPGTRSLWFLKQSVQPVCLILLGFKLLCGWPTGFPDSGLQNFLLSSG